MIGKMPDESAKKFEEMLNEGQAEMTDVILKLRKTLETYGFRGTITCTLDVTVNDREYGTEEARARRRILHNFKR